MVWLVFCPYTQSWQSICTSELLRVSSGLILLKHSSPSFWSQHMCSYPNLSRSRIDWPMMRSRLRGDHTSDHTTFFCLLVSMVLRLALIIDSLVRDSRKVIWNHMTTNNLNTVCVLFSSTDCFSSSALHAVHHGPKQTWKRVANAKEHVPRLLCWI